MDSKYKNFPKDFLWGASSSSHQYEGGTHNQWTVWELSHATENARNAEKHLGGLPNWRRIKKEAEDPANYVSGNGLEHYKRYREDFKIVKDLNLNAFRFGIEWSRIEPEEGKWDQGAIDHYKKYIAELRRQGIEPFINLWHWTNPVWFEEKGAFTKKSNLKYFERFVAKVADELLDDIKYVLTINEANNYMLLGYILPVWPPQEKMRIDKALRVYYNLAVAHRRAYKILKSKNPALQVGIAHQPNANIPRNPRNPIQLMATRTADYAWFLWFYDRVKKHQDFVGMNFYNTMYYKHVLYESLKPTDPIDDRGFYMEPSRIYDVIMKLSNRYKKPVIVTENGTPDAQDKHRQWWIEETMEAMDRAIADGADVRGYLHWSLLDNFEWAEGYWAKYGLVTVDREHGMKRTLKPSAKWWANQLKDLKK